MELITLDFTVNNNVDLKELLSSCRMPFLIESRAGARKRVREIERGERERERENVNSI